jgi:hypothetical protein
LALALACKYVRGEEEEEEGSSSTTVPVAATLMAAIAFQMSLFYAMNARDDDLRKYTYEIISATVSIFCAVLLFQSANDLFEQYVHHLTRPWLLVAHMGHMLLWFLLMQGSLAIISGAVGSTDVESWTPKKKDDVDANLKCFAVLIAHITGFASVNAWGFLQQSDTFSANPLTSLAVLPLAMLGQVILQRIFDKVREKVAMGDDGEWDAAEEMWHEGTEEAEDDVMALCCSNLMSQTIRFQITGKLPTLTGAEGWDELVAHGKIQALILLLVGLAMASLSAIMVLKTPKFNSKATARAYTCITATVNMCFSWNAFYSFQWFTASFFSPEAPDMMLLDVVTTMFACCCAGCFIFVLDKINDAMKEDDEGNEHRGKTLMDGIIFVIQGMGIFIGFAWEQCFDVATESLATILPHPHVSKMGLCLLCAAIIVPAWRWWILPMVLREGWKFGFVIEPDDKVWEKVFEAGGERLTKIVDTTTPMLGDAEKAAVSALENYSDPAQDEHEVAALRARNAELHKVLQNLASDYHKHMDAAHGVMDRIESSRAGLSNSM